MRYSVEIYHNTGGRHGWRWQYTLHSATFDAAAEEVQVWRAEGYAARMLPRD